MNGIFVQILSNLYFCPKFVHNFNLYTMITFEPIIIPNNKRNDGTYPVKIRVYFNGKSRRLPTTWVCHTSDITRTKRKSVKIKKDSGVRDKAKELIDRMRAVVGNYTMTDLEGKDVDWVVKKIKEGLNDKTFHLDFFDWADKYVTCKAEGTRKGYIRALNAFERFLGVRELDINSINKSMLLEFVDFIEAEPKMTYDRRTGLTHATDKKRVPKATSSIVLLKLQHIYNAAKERYNDEDENHILIPRSPFSSIKKVFPSGDTGQDPLPRDVMQKLISFETDDVKMRIALDVFIVSFATMGANYADLYAAKPIKDNVWIYNRQKITSRKAEMRVFIPDQIIPHLRRLQKGDNVKWWLPQLHEWGDKDYSSQMMVYHLRRWQKAEGVDLDFTLYAARHSWAQYARDMGYDLASVNECLCHKDNLEMGRIYASLTWEQKNEINQKVIDSFVWF